MTYGNHDGGPHQRGIFAERLEEVELRVRAGTMAQGVVVMYRLRGLVRPYLAGPGLRIPEVSWESSPVRLRMSDIVFAEQALELALSLPVTCAVSRSAAICPWKWPAPMNRRGC